MQLITVFQAFSSAEAQLTRARLEAAGFHPLVEHELSALSMEGYSMAAGGILVRVPEDEVDEVKEFLSAPPTPSE
jgi:hypothetical protein